jgi:hypothetical protein
MTFSRGRALFGVDGANATAEKEGETEDMDELVCREGARADEDMFLPQPMPSLIQSLPSLLRESRRGGLCQKNWTSNQLLEKRKLKLSKDLRHWMTYIFPPAVQAKVSCHGFGATSVESLLLEDTIDIKLFLEYIPVLRRIGFLERATEYACREKGEEQPTCRRTTRRQARAARHHYFDTLSRQLQLDNADQTSSQIGTLMANSLLVYDETS